MVESKTVHIEITENEVRFLRPNGRSRPETDSLLFHYTPLGVDHAELTEAVPEIVRVLKEFRERSLRTAKAEAYLYIPFRQGQGLIREFSLPWLPVKNRNSAVRYYIEHEFPITNDKFVYDFDILESPAKESLLVTVAAIRTELLDSYTHCLKKAGYHLKHIAYAFNTMGEWTEAESGGGTLYLNGSTGNRVQIVIFEGTFPKYINETNAAPNEISRYQLYLFIKNTDLPVAKIMTDDSPYAQELAAIIVDMGLVRNSEAQPSSETMIFRESDTVTDIAAQTVHTGNNELAAEYGVRAYATLGGFVQSRTQRGINLYRNKMIADKLKLTFLTACFLVISLLAQGILQWYPGKAEYNQLQAEAGDLLATLAQLQEKYERSALQQWAGAQEQACKELEQLQKVMRTMESEITLTRLHYDQGNLQFWAQCQDNTVIAGLISRLSAEGWKAPVLADYKYQPRNITFSITVCLNK